MLSVEQRQFCSAGYASSAVQDMPILQYNSSSISLIVHSVATTMALSLSGRQFLQAEEILYSARHASYEESLEAGVQCFLLAIDVSGLSLCQ